LLSYKRAPTTAADDAPAPLAVAPPDGKLPGEADEPGDCGEHAASAQASIEMHKTLFRVMGKC
jgi:hypothetical protein